MAELPRVSVSVSILCSPVGVVHHGAEPFVEHLVLYEDDSLTHRHRDGEGLPFEIRYPPDEVPPELFLLALRALAPPVRREPSVIPQAESEGSA